MRLLLILAALLGLAFAATKELVDPLFVNPKAQAHLGTPPGLKPELMRKVLFNEKN